MTTSFAATSASAGTFEYTLDPASGTTVESLKTITMTAAAGTVMDVTAAENIKVYKNGAEFCGVSAKDPDWSGAKYIFTLETEATEAGTYEFVIPAETIELQQNDGMTFFTNDEIIAIYNIEAGSSDKFSYTLDPESGSSVESLKTITMTADAGTVMDVTAAENIKVYKDGAEFSGVSAKDPDWSGAKYIFTLETEAAVAGTYEFVIPAGTIELQQNDGMIFFTNDEIRATYTVTGGTVVVPEFEYTLNPASGSTVESLETIAISCDPDKAAIEVKDASGIKVLKDGEDFCGVTSEETKNSEVYTFTLATKATEAGTYELVIPAGAIDELVNNGDEIISNKEIRATYTIEAPKTPVVYDLEIVKCKPAEGEVDMDMIQFESIIVTVKDTGLGADPEATATLAAEDGSYTYTGQFKFSWGVQFIMFVTEAPKYNGKYTFTIPQGSFGDAEWMADHSTGHSNPEIVVDYTFTGLKDPASPVAFDIVPESYLPATDATVNDLATVTVNFSKYYNAFSEKAVAHLSCTEAHYEATATPSRTYGDSFSYTFDPAPTEAGNYLFVIEEGAFGDNDYAEDNTLGHASAAISVVYEFVPEGSGINAIFSEDNDSIIYSIDGKVIGKSVKNLPAGLYIREGKKIIVK